ncbi:hypothetical protein D3C71_1046330 [compost metagenome]
MLPAVRAVLKPRVGQEVAATGHGVLHHGRERLHHLRVSLARDASTDLVDLLPEGSDLAALLGDGSGQRG